MFLRTGICYYCRKSEAATQSLLHQPKEHIQTQIWGLAAIVYIVTEIVDLYQDIYQAKHKQVHWSDAIGQWNGQQPSSSNRSPKDTGQIASCFSIQ